MSKEAPTDLEQMVTGFNKAGTELIAANLKWRQLAKGEKNYLSALMVKIRQTNAAWEKISMAELEMRARATPEYQTYVDGVCAAKNEVERLELKKESYLIMWKSKQSDQSLERTKIAAGIYHVGGK